MKRTNKRSKLLDNVPKYGTPEWGHYQYERAKEANRGHNYRYWNEKWWKEMESKEWVMFKMRNGEQGVSHLLAVRLPNRKANAL